MAIPKDDWMTGLPVDPTKKPEGFDFQNYLKINTDLGAAGIDTEQEALRHYQNYGIAEKRNIGALSSMQPPAPTGSTNTPSAPLSSTSATDNWMSGQWYNPNAMPQNFDWQRYVAANKDLSAAGIDTEEEAMRHYFNYGQQEGRNINAATPTRFEDLSGEDRRAGLEAYRQATGFDGFVITNPGEDSSNHPVWKWINENYIPQGQLKTDYSIAKPIDTFNYLDTLETSNRPVDQLANIKQAWDENKDTPSKMRQLMEEYGITLGDLSQATGETYSKLNTWVTSGDILGVVGFRVNRPGAYEAYRGELNPVYDPNPTFSTGPSTPESRLASYESSQRRAPNTFDPLAYEKYNQNKLGVNATGALPQSATSIVSKMNTDAQAYWDSQPAGSTFEVAGGTLTRVNDNQSIFTSASGKRSVMNRQDAFNTIADRIPEFAQAWKENYGYDASASEASLRSEFDRSFQKDPIAFLSQLGIGNFTLDEVNGKKYLADSKSGQMIPMEALNSIESLGRYIGDARSKVESAYGYEGTPLGDVWSQLNSGDSRFVSTDPIRAVDPLFKNVDFEPYRNVPAGAFYAIADQVYGGKNMSFEDLNRIQEETGSVGAYVEDPNNPGKYMVDRARANTPKSAFDLADPLYADYLQNKATTRTTPIASKDTDELLRQFGATGTAEKPTDENILAGFKYAKDSGFSEKKLKETLGQDLYNQYQGQLKNFATTNINNIVADNSLTFAESANVAKLARDLGFNSQQLADLTGKDKSLFDTILTNYDANRDIVIKDTLSGPNILTDADRIVASYALQNEFGFTDDDIARATGVDVNTIKNNLSPVRNFQDDFSKIANNTDSTTQQLKDFVLNAKSNAAIDKLYGESLTGYENKIAELEQKWSRFGSDPVQSENLFQQLNAQKNALGGQYYKGVFGDLENSAAQLVNKGLDTLGDLGKKDKFQTNLAEVRYTSNGENLFSPDGVSFFKIDDDNGQYIPVDPKNVQTTYGKYVDDGSGFGTGVYEKLSEEELATLKDGTYQQKIGSVVIDKDTGKELTGLDGNLLFQRSGGHIKTKKNYLTARFTDDGIPYITASQEKSGLYAMVSDVGPMVISIAAMIPGPHQPFAMAANAALALEQKNYLGAVLSGLGAYGISTGNELTALKAAEASGDIINASRVLDLQNTAANVKLAQTAVGGFAALKAENLPGVINASLSAYGQSGGTLPSGVTTAFQAVNLAKALESNNVPAALTALGDLTGSKDLYVAASAKNLIDALQTGDMSNIAQAGLVFGNSFKAANQARQNTNTGDLGNRVYDDTITQAGADAYLRAKQAGASDEDAMAAANAVTGVQINPIDAGGPNLSTTTTYDPRVNTVDTNFGDLQGAIESNAMGDAVRAEKLNLISQTPRFNDAYSQARELLGPNQTFTWNGKQYSTATAEERPDLSAPAARPAPPVQPATDQSAAETARLTSKNAELDRSFKAAESTGFFRSLYNDLNNQFKLQGEGAVEYLKNNPNSPITSNVSTALEASGELSKNIIGGTALFFNNKPLSDAVVKGGNDLINLGQSVGTGPKDTKNWNDTMNLVSKAEGFEKLGVMAGRILDGTSGLGRQVEVELRQELPALFLGGGGVKGILIASGLVDTADTGGNAVLDAYQQEIDKGGNHESALDAGRTAGATAAATEAVIQATLGKLGDLAAGKLDNLVAKGATKTTSEGVVEGVQEGGAGAAVDVALGNTLDLNKYLTQGVAGAAVGKGTATATSGSDAAQSESVGNSISNAAASGNPAAINSAINGSISTAVESGADVDLSIASTVSSAVNSGVDVNAVIKAATDAAVNSGNDVSITSDADVVTISNATTGADTAVNTATGVTTSVDNNTGVTTVIDGKTTTKIDGNTVVQTIVDANTKTQSTVSTNLNTNTQTTIKINTDNGEVIDFKESPIPLNWNPPVVTPPVVGPAAKPPAAKPPAAPVKETATVPKLQPKLPEESRTGAGGISLPVGINVDPASLRSRVTGGAIDPLARVKEAQEELERTAMMQNVDPRLMQILQQRSNPQQQSQQFDDDIGALSKLLSGNSDDQSSKSNYYSYGSEESIDDILGGKAANYKEGGFVEPLKASGGSMALPLLAKSGGALGHYKGREDFKDGKHVAGDGDGQSDDIPAWLADGEFVFPADVVSALGNGSTKAGTDKLYAMMHGIRDRARSKGPKDLPPPALKSPLDYLKSSKRSTS
jgi:hypothetical protein